MKRTSALRLLVAGLLVNVFACSLQQMTEKDVTGDYEARLPDGGTEVLQLRPDGTCRQIIRLQNGKQYDAVGTWRLRREAELFPDGHRVETGGYTLDFKYIRETLTATGEIDPGITQPSLNIISTPVSRSLTGRIKIMLGENVDYYKRN